MAKVILDNLIFDLQPHGGITSIWEAVVRGAARSTDIEAGFFQRSCHDDRLQALAGLDVKAIHEGGPVFLNRFRTVQVPSGTQVFHSSYFRVASDASTRNVVTVHDCITERFDRGLRRLLHVAQKTRSLRRAYSVICVSNNTRQDLLNFYPWLNPHRVSVVHNGIDLNYFTPAGRRRNSSLLYVGARNAHKNFRLALDLVATETARSLDLRLQVVGGTPLTDEEQALIADLAITDRVHTLGALSRDGVREAYRTSYALIYPSLYEGFGIPPLEAMACGCPVLCSNASSLPEVVGEAAELFDPLSVESAESALARLSNDHRRAELTRRGYGRVASFSHELMVEKTLSIYRALAK